MATVRGYRVLTDDRDARALAMERQIPVSGTLGVLIRLVNRGTLSLAEANDLLNCMIVAGYRSPVSDLAEML